MISENDSKKGKIDLASNYKRSFQKMISYQRNKKIFKIGRNNFDNSFPKFVYHVIEENCQIYQ